MSNIIEFKQWPRKMATLGGYKPTQERVLNGCAGNMVVGTLKVYPRINLHAYRAVHYRGVSTYNYGTVPKLFDYKRLNLVRVQ